ncbi:MAG: geranylgeranyl pyrophosphate synthase, partial [Candidatus Azotimanducaceae bacterium]
YANDMAQAEIDQALHCLTPLPPSSFKEAMQTLAKFALERSY